jgi:membrane protein implicated in regulation of membrane protease activity
MKLDRLEVFRVIPSKIISGTVGTGGDGVTMELFRHPAMIWFVIGLICIIGEFMIPGVIVAFFGAGAWVVALLLLVVDMSPFWQILIFVVVSVASLLLLRKKLTARSEGVKDMTDEFYGKTAEVEETVKKGGYGKVRFKGAVWKARTEAEHPLEPGRLVRIVGNESITLIVEPIKKKEA